MKLWRIPAPAPCASRSKALASGGRRSNPDTLPSFSFTGTLSSRAADVLNALASVPSFVRPSPTNHLISYRGVFTREIQNGRAAIKSKEIFHRSSLSPSNICFEFPLISAVPGIHGAKSTRLEKLNISIFVAFVRSFENCRTRLPNRHSECLKSAVQSELPLDSAKACGNDGISCSEQQSKGAPREERSSSLRGSR
jgi:hypothetical protein